MMFINFIKKFFNTISFINLFIYYLFFFTFLFIQIFREICTGNDGVKGQILDIMEPLAKAYFELYKEQKETKKLKSLQKEEFFGLRDFYW